MRWAWSKTLINFDWPGFRSIEVMILDYCLKSLSEDQIPPFVLWRSSINYIQRVEGGREIDFYLLKIGKPTRPKTCEIPGFPSDGVALRLLISCGNGTAAIGLTAIQGVPFSIESDLPLLKMKAPFCIREAKSDTPLR